MIELGERRHVLFHHDPYASHYDHIYCIAVLSPGKRPTNRVLNVMELSEFKTETVNYTDDSHFTRSSRNLDGRTPLLVIPEFRLKYQSPPWAKRTTGRV